MIKKTIFFLSLLLFSISTEASMNVSIKSLAINSMAVQDLSCQIPSGGMPELFKIVGLLSSFKSKLDVCVSELSGIKTKWSFSGGKIKSVKAFDSKTLKNNTCIEKTLSGKAFVDTGDCEAILFLGKEKNNSN